MVIAAAEDRVRSRQNRRAIGRSTGALLRPPVLPDRSRFHHGVGWRPRRHHRGRKWNTCDQAGRVLGRLARSENIRGEERRTAESRGGFWNRRSAVRTSLSAGLRGSRRPSAPPPLSPSWKRGAAIADAVTGGHGRWPARCDHQPRAGSPDCPWAESAIGSRRGGIVYRPDHPHPWRYRAPTSPALRERLREEVDIPARSLDIPAQHPL
jgi:hypothetical protein